MILKHSVKALAVLAVVGISGIAQADGLAVGAKVGTLGFGLEATTNVVPALLNVRLQGNIFNYKKTISDTQVRYDAKLKLQSVGLLADIYPFAGKFRLTAGAYYNGNKLNMTGAPIGANKYTFNNQKYTLSSVKATVDFNKFAPYAGIGWGDAVSSGSPFGFSFELGALYMGKPKTSITATGAGAAAAAADIAVEKKKLDDAMNNMKLYPVVSVGLNWKF